MGKKEHDYKLCYIEDGLAYFTNLELSEQWGDDWNDLPYEHNAGEPYFDDKDQIKRVAFKHYYYEEPKDKYPPNSPYSVECLNEGKAPWLSSWSTRDSTGEEILPIYAGISMEEFIDTIIRTDGSIFLEVDKEQYKKEKIKNNK